MGLVVFDRDDLNEAMRKALGLDDESPPFGRMRITFRVERDDVREVSFTGVIVTATEKVVDVEIDGEVLYGRSE